MSKLLSIIGRKSLLSLTFRTSAHDYPGISSGGKSFGWVGDRERVGRRTTLATCERSGSQAARSSQRLLSSHAHSLRFTVVETGCMLAGQVKRRNLSTYQA